MRFGFLFVVVGWFLGVAQNAPAALITFDNLSGNQGTVPNGYGGRNCLAGLFTTCTLFRTFLVAEKCLVFRRC